MSRKQNHPTPSRALVPSEPGRAQTGPGADPIFAAQVLGAGGLRGLKGGAQTRETAKSTYLETEWSGDADRRAPVGGKASKAV